MPRPRRTNKRLAPLSNQSSGPSLVVFLFLVWAVEKACTRCNLAQAATRYLKGYQCQKIAVVHGWGMKGVTVVPSFFVVPSYPKPNFEKLTIISYTQTKSPVFLASSSFVSIYILLPLSGLKRHSYHLSFLSLHIPMLPSILTAVYALPTLGGLGNNRPDHSIHVRQVLEFCPNKRHTSQA